MTEVTQRVHIHTIRVFQNFKSLEVIVILAIKKMKILISELPKKSAVCLFFFFQVASVFIYLFLLVGG